MRSSPKLFIKTNSNGLDSRYSWKRQFCFKLPHFCIFVAFANNEVHILHHVWSVVVFAQLIVDLAFSVMTCKGLMLWKIQRLLSYWLWYRLSHWYVYQCTPYDYTAFVGWDSCFTVAHMRGRLFGEVFLHGTLTSYVNIIFLNAIYLNLMCTTALVKYSTNSDGQPRVIVTATLIRYTERLRSSVFSSSVCREF